MLCLLGRDEVEVPDCLGIPKLSIARVDGDSMVSLYGLCRGWSDGGQTAVDRGGSSKIG